MSPPNDISRLQTRRSTDAWESPLRFETIGNRSSACWRGSPLAEGATLSVISFNGNKTVTAGGGGMVIGRDPALLALVRHLSTTARTGSDYSHDRIGFNYCLTNLQAAVGCAQMERFERARKGQAAHPHRLRQGFRRVARGRGFPRSAGDRQRLLAVRPGDCG
jgi:perosamine synthetase